MKYFRSVYTDPRREFHYEPYEHLGEPPSTHFVASTCPPSFAEFSAVIRSRRNSSAPGPNGIPYTVWKRCPNLQMRLFSIISRAWKLTEIPPSWQQAVIRLVHKSGSPNEPSNFRPIALTNCDGKIFFALVAKSVLKHMTKNSFFDLRLQKGFLPGVSGCIEHTSLISEALRDARSHQRSICVSWLDLRNAFGSVRHSLIQFALRYYGFPRHFQQLVFRYYESLVAMVEVPDVFQHRHSILESAFFKVVHCHLCCSTSLFSFYLARSKSPPFNHMLTVFLVFKTARCSPLRMRMILNWSLAFQRRIRLY